MDRAPDTRGWLRETPPQDSRTCLGVSPTAKHGVSCTVSTRVTGPAAAGPTRRARRGRGRTWWPLPGHACWKPGILVDLPLW
jgi:hypothetical protein